MTKRDLRRWIILAVIILTLIDVWGGALGAVGAFLPPLVKEFGWSNARVSMLASLVAVGFALGCPIAGWMLDRMDPRIPIVIGAAIAGAALIAASRIHAFETIAIIYVIAGIGCGMSTSVPASVVVANWFQSKRGLAMGLAMTGASAGGMITVYAVARITAAVGWRAAYLALGIPVFVIIIPLVIAIVRGRPAQTAESGTAASPSRPSRAATPSLSEDVAGLSLSESTHTRSFWFLGVLTVFWGFTVFAIVTELMVYLIDIGYPRATAAVALSLTFGFTAVGKTVFGLLADWIGARLSQFIAFVMMAVGSALLVYAHHEFLLWMFLPIFGLAWGSPLALFPLVTIDSLGLKNYGTIGGVLSAANVFGNASGPIVVGMLVDATKSWALGFELCIVAATIAAVLTMGCRREYNELAAAGMPADVSNSGASIRNAAQD